MITTLLNNKFKNITSIFINVRWQHLPNPSHRVFSPSFLRPSERPNVYKLVKLEYEHVHLMPVMQKESPLYLWMGEFSTVDLAEIRIH